MLCEAKPVDFSDFVYWRLERLVGFQDEKCALFLGSEGADNAFVIAGGDDAVTGEALEKPGEFGVDRVRDGDEVTEGRFGICVAGPQICAGHRADRAGIEAVRCAHGGVDRAGDGGSGRRDVLEGSRRR